MFRYVAIHKHQWGTNAHRFASMEAVNFNAASKAKLAKAIGIDFDPESEDLTIVEEGNTQVIPSDTMAEING